MSKRVLVAYGSKMGATAEIAERIKEQLSAAGLEVNLKPVSQVKDLNPYQGVVLGSAVYYGRWRAEAVRFLKDREGELSRKQVWFFSSGPLGVGDPVELLDGWTFPPLQQAIADRIKPRGIAVFHGVLRRDQLNPVERFILDKMGTLEGDFRDWEQVAEWSIGIARELTG